MPSIPSSPRTPTRRRKPSIDLAFTSASPQSHGSRRPSINRMGSQYSIESPITPRLLSSQDWSGSNGASHAADTGDSNGLGNLADELAEAWDEEEEGEQHGESLEAQLNQVDHSTNGFSSRNYHNDLGIDMPRPQSPAASNLSLSPPKQPTRAKHRRVNSQYDGSDYGDESDFDNADGISPGLGSRMAAIESLARRGSEANGSDMDDVVKRVADSLKDLPSQSGVENGTTRLITSHAALSSHLANQTRLVLNLSHPLTSPLSIPPDPEIIDEILPFLSDLLMTLPTPTIQCLSSLHSLHTSTRDLQSTLTQLNDTVYMTRQTSIQASRKLKTASDMVAEMRKESDAREEGVRWIEKGGWDAKLKSRESAKVCRDVVGGFEEVCKGWRERLAGDVEVGAA